MAERTACGKKVGRQPCKCAICKRSKHLKSRRSSGLVRRNAEEGVEGEQRHDVLCQCGWGQLQMPESEIPERCPICDFNLRELGEERRELRENCCPNPSDPYEEGARDARHDRFVGRKSDLSWHGATMERPGSYGHEHSRAYRAELEGGRPPLRHSRWRCERCGQSSDGLNPICSGCRQVETTGNPGFLPLCHSCGIETASPDRLCRACRSGATRANGGRVRSHAELERRHGQLVNKKHSAGLTRAEERELSGVVKRLEDEVDAPFYEPVVERLRGKAGKKSRRNPHEWDAWTESRPEQEFAQARDFLGREDRYPRGREWEGWAQPAGPAEEFEQARELVGVERNGRRSNPWNYAVGSTPDARLWRCPSCQGVNAWNARDAELASGHLGEDVAVATGSSFDNVCGHCRTDFVRRSSPIRHSAYTHEDD